METMTEIVSVPVIVAIVYAAMAIYKHFLPAEKWVKLIPLWSALLGVILGVVAYYAAPEIIPAENVLVAILIGGASGLAATGTNQIFKQIKKNKTDDNTDEKENK